MDLPTFPISIPWGAFMQFDKWRDTRTKMALLGALLTLLPLIYGGIHLLALHFSFATTVEHHLWISSCVAIMSTPVIIIFHVMIVYPLRKLFSCTRTNMRTCFQSPILVHSCRCLFRVSVLQCLFTFLRGYTSSLSLLSASGMLQSVFIQRFRGHRISHMFE